MSFLYVVVNNLKEKGMFSGDDESWASRITGVIFLKLQENFASPGTILFTDVIPNQCNLEILKVKHFPTSFRGINSDGTFFTATFCNCNVKKIPDIEK